VRPRRQLVFNIAGACREAAGRYDYMFVIRVASVSIAKPEKVKAPPQTQHCNRARIPNPRLQAVVRKGRMTLQGVRPGLPAAKRSGPGRMAPSFVHANRREPARVLPISRHRRSAAEMRS